MRCGITLKPLTLRDDAEDALDLTIRAADYAVLEVGRLPDETYIRDFFTACPPGLDADCLLHFGVMEEPAMVGMICVARGYEYPEDWWIGLMLLDPAFRGQGIGHKVIALVKKRARIARVNMLKLSVLRANPRAVRFWEREGFVFHRDAPALPGSDGHDRVVLKCQL